jgi:hypothetical protein
MMIWGNTMKNKYVDIWSKEEIVEYLHYLLEKGNVKKCSKLKVEVGYLNAYYPKCTEGFASREEARNVKTSSTGHSAPRYYEWPVCPAVCPFFEETTDFTSSLMSEKIEKQIPEKESLTIPKKVDVSIIREQDERATLELEKAPKGGDEIDQKAKHFISEVQIMKLEKLSKKTGLSVLELIKRAIDEYLERNEKG